MSYTASYAMSHRPQLSLLDKTVAFAAWVLAGTIFLTIGWLAMEPDDPQGAVSILTRSRGIVMLVQAGALAAVAAALATAIAGRRLADVGTFAAAVGLAVVSLRGGTAASLLVETADLSAAAQRWLALQLAAETLGWFVVISVVMGVSGLVARWCFPEPRGKDDADLDLCAIAAQTLAGRDAPVLGHWLFRVPAGRQTAPRTGLKHTLLVAAIGLLAIHVLSGGLSSRAIRHGQACFVVAAGVAIASWIAYRRVPVGSALWSILAVPLIAVIGYIWAGMRPAVAGLPLSQPASHFLRVLPIQYVSVGTAAALTTFWCMYTPPATGGGASRSSATRTAQRGRR